MRGLGGLGIRDRRRAVACGHASVPAAAGRGAPRPTLAAEPRVAPKARTRFPVRGSSSGAAQDSRPGGSKRSPRPGSRTGGEFGQRRPRAERALGRDVRPGATRATPRRSVRAPDPRRDAAAKSSRLGAIPAGARPSPRSQLPPQPPSTAPRAAHASAETGSAGAGSSRRPTVTRRATASGTAASSSRAVAADSFSARREGAAERDECRRPSAPAQAPPEHEGRDTASGRAAAVDNP